MSQANAVEVDLMSDVGFQVFGGKMSQANAVEVDLMSDVT